MLLILPPSETKRDGGAPGSRLDLAALSFPALTPQRSSALKALGALSRNLRIATGALSLGPTQQHEVERNREVLTSPVMPALDRYTGVLYDGLRAAELTTAEREFANAHVVIHSALFGLSAAGDPIPAYRVSHNSRLPGLALGKLWRTGIAAELAAHDGLILDLRSEAYASLGRAPAQEGSYYVRVVSQGANGRRTALSHFNKKAKGEFTRAVISAGIVHPDLASLLAWAGKSGILLESGVAGEIDLVV